MWIDPICKDEVRPQVSNKHPNSVLHAGRRGADRQAKLLSQGLPEDRKKKSDPPPVLYGRNGPLSAVRSPAPSRRYFWNYALRLCPVQKREPCHQTCMKTVKMWGENGDILLDMTDTTNTFDQMSQIELFKNIGKSK